MYVSTRVRDDILHNNALLDPYVTDFHPLVNQIAQFQLEQKEAALNAREAALPPGM